MIKLILCFMLVIIGLEIRKNQIEYNNTKQGDTTEASTLIDYTPVKEVDQDYVYIDGIKVQMRPTKLNYPYIDEIEDFSNLEFSEEFLKAKRECPACCISCGEYKK